MLSSVLSIHPAHFRWCYLPLIAHLQCPSFCSVRHIIHRPTSLIPSTTGMDQALHRVVNSHILRFAITMRVYVHIFGAVTVWWFDRTNVFEISLLELADGVILFIGHSEHIGSRQNSTFQCVMKPISEFEPCLTKHVDEFWSEGATKVIISIVNKTWGRSDLIMAKKVEESLL